MTERDKLWRRLLLPAVLLASIFVSAESPTGARGCPYFPDEPSIPDEPNACEQRCIDRYDACISGGGTYSACATQRSCCLHLCGS